MIRVAYGGSFLLLRKIYKAYYERNNDLMVEYRA